MRKMLQALGVSAVLLCGLLGMAQGQTTGRVGATTSVVYNGVSHVCSVNATTAKSVDKGKLMVGWGNRSRVYYTGDVADVVYHSRQSVDVTGFVLIAGKSYPVEIAFRFEDRAWRSSWRLFGPSAATQKSVPKLKIYGSVSVSYFPVDTPQR